MSVCGKGLINISAGVNCIECFYRDASHYYMATGKSPIVSSYMSHTAGGKVCSETILLYVSSEDFMFSYGFIFVRI